MTMTAVSSALHEHVMHELAWDPQVTSGDIGVTSHDGVVTLTGFVPTFAEKIAAERAAFRIQGTRAVANDLVVRLSNERTDPDLARDAASALRLNLSVPPSVKVAVRSGYLTLEGAVDWWYQRNAAEEAVRHVTGVRGVHNSITVKPHVSASVVKTRIEDALRRSAEVDSRNVHVTTVNDKVVLNGTVRSYAERMEAARAAWASPGVTAVDNHIEVTP